MSLSSPEKIRELLDVIQSVSQELNLDKLLQLIMERTSSIMSADRSTLFLRVPGRGEGQGEAEVGQDLRHPRPARLRGSGCERCLWAGPPARTARRAPHGR
jgi:GAF domain-containing protein